MSLGFIVQSHDTVGAFVAERLVKTGDDNDHLQRAALYIAYRDAYPEERNKKLALGKHKWFEQMQKHLGSSETDGYFKQKKIKVDDKSVPKKDVWLGWQLVPYEM